MDGETEPTRGVETLLGDPKRAIVRLAVPMVVAMSAQTIYNLADAIWVSGCGPRALSAVGSTSPSSSSVSPSPSAWASAPARRSPGGSARRTSRAWTPSPATAW
jgi:hypothetical protein